MVFLMIRLVDVSDELKEMSKELLETIEMEDREYSFKKEKCFVERNVPASKFRKIFKQGD